jgi:hypothetical protein
MSMVWSILMLAAMALAADEVPAVGRPSRHFYGAIGDQVWIAMHASPVTLRVEDSLVLTVTVTGATNPDRIERPDLRQLEEYASRFYIDDLPDEGPTSPGERRFRYRLRPKSVRARELPPLLFLYYQPKLKYFAATATQDEIALTVTPRNAVEPPTESAERPSFLYSIPSSDELIRRQPASPELILLSLAWIGPALAFAFWYRWWRWQNPAGVRLAQLRRMRVVRQALDELERLRANQSPELADRVVAITLGVLRERHGIASTAATPQEIVHALTRARIAPEVIAQADRFFHACDAARFGPAATDSIVLLAAANNLVLAVGFAE